MRKLQNKLILASVLILFCFNNSFAEGRYLLKEEIYAKLKCCGCKISFETCLCKEAKEMKVYVDALIDAGLKKEEIFYKVAKRFTLNAISDAAQKEKVKQRLLSEAGEKKPQLILQPSSIDWGDIKKNKGMLRKAVKIFNKGNRDLVINNIRVSCDCVKVSLINQGQKSPDFGVSGSPAAWSAVIRPSGEALLDIQVNSNHPSVVTGEMIREVYILSNDPLYTQTNLEIRANVVE